MSVKSHLTYGVSVHPENAVTYSAGNEGQKICGVFSEDAPLLRSSGVAVVIHTFRWPFFFIAKAVRMRICIHSYGCRTAGEYPARWPFIFIAKVVRMRICIHSYGCRTAGEYPACPTIVNSFSLAQNDAASPVGARTDSTTRYSYNARRGQFPRMRIGHGIHSSQDSTRRGFCTLVLFILSRLGIVRM